MFCLANSTALVHKTRSPQNRSLKKRRTAFTLIELMVVIVILGLLSGVVTISVRSYLVRSRQGIARLQIGEICNALDTFYTHYDRYPNNQEGLLVLQQRSDDFVDGILDKIPNDPWKHAYEYVSPGKNGPYEVICYGADHREGGTGADKDLTSEDLGS